MPGSASRGEGCMLQGDLLWGTCLLWGPCLLRGACLLQGACLLWGVSALGGLLLGVCLLWGGACLLLGGVVSQHAPRQTPPIVNRMTNRCKNITLATTSLRPVKMTRPNQFSEDTYHKLCGSYLAQSSHHQEMLHTSEHFQLMS